MRIPVLYSDALLKAHELERERNLEQRNRELEAKRAAIKARNGGAAIGQSISEVLVETRKKSKANAKRALEAAIEEWEAMRKSASFQSMRGRHFVALYWELHEAVYREPPIEVVEESTWMRACSSAEKLLRDEFRNNSSTMTEFMRWVWARERAAEKRRKADGQSGRRIDWGFMFVRRHLVTDWRVDMRRKAGA